MKDMLTKINETCAFLQQKGFGDAHTGVVLGTGLGSFINHIKIEAQVGYEDIPHFPHATVESHKGQLITGMVGSRKVIAMQGRFHYYEGYSMQEITFPIRVMKQLGIEQLLLSNAAGGINLNYKKGTLVLLEDHINLLPENPLRGLHGPDYGNRFVDMSAPYAPELNEKFLRVAAASSVDLKQGVYASVMGPNLETRAEYRYIKMIGADMVGMSTVPEVIVANHVGLPCAAVSVITDECDPDNLHPVDITEIIRVAGQADAVLSKLFADVITHD
ncbi:MAG: purine-nucleoside phosphorylase [Chitinophagaceae bacterium]|nr:purine-nucleoside phosphorylase [Chitinophagaceae bacterium]